MIINTDKKFIHIAIPRTATTCVNIALGNLEHPEPDEHHCTIAEVVNKNPEYKDFYKFTFVRNPFDKLVSTYYEFKKNRKKRYSGKITHENLLLSEFDVSSCDVENFQNFCRNLKESPWVDDLFFKPQFEYININGEDVMNYIGRFENLNDDWSKVKESIGMPEVNLEQGIENEPRGFFRGSHHPPYPEMYTSTEIKIVEDLYHKDLEYFNYSFS